MSELQGVADHVVVVGRGRVIADALVADLLAAASADRVTVTAPPSVAAAAAAVLRTAGATVSLDGPDTLTVAGLPASAVVARLTAAGVQFSEVSTHRATLEEAYFDLTRDAVEFRAEVRS